jgi:hypothetical protein
MSTPPPPPVKKSGALKWILIGCGGVAFIGLLVCGGCILFGVSITKSVLKVQEDVEALVRNNPEVSEKIGDIKRIDMLNNDQAGNRSDVVFQYHVEGTKGQGTVHARVAFKMTSFELKSATFETSDGESVKLK